MSLKSKVKHELTKTNLLKQVKDLLASSLLGHMRNDYNYAKTILPIFKELLLDTVDEIWTFGKKTFKDMDSLEDHKNHSQRIRYPSQERSQERYHLSYAELEKSSIKKIKIKIPNIDKSSKKFKEVTSEFSFSNGPTFSKSIREIDRKYEITPGPSSYDITTANVKLKPPKTIFPTVTKRDSYIPVTSSPGPARYYFSLRHLSKQ